MPFADDELTLDGFLDGKVKIFQPRHGYRAATDPVLLAASVPARPADKVLELGCGVGTALLCLGHRVSNLSLTGLDIQSDYLDLARRNAVQNAIDCEFFLTSVDDKHPELAERTFDRVLINPPYFDPNANTAPSDSGKAHAHLSTSASLSSFISYGLKRLRPKGTINIIHRTESLQDLLLHLADATGDIRILPLTSRTGRPARRLLIQATKGSRSPLVMLPPLILHTGSKHGSDKPDHSAVAQNVLRHGQSIDMS